MKMEESESSQNGIIYLEIPHKTQPDHIPLVECNYDRFLIGFRSCYGLLLNALRNFSLTNSLMEDTYYQNTIKTQKVLYASNKFLWVPLSKATDSADRNQISQNSGEIFPLEQIGSNIYILPTKMCYLNLYSSLFKWICGNLAITEEEYSEFTKHNSISYDIDSIQENFLFIGSSSGKLIQWSIDREMSYYDYGRITNGDIITMAMTSRMDYIFMIDGTTNSLKQFCLKDKRLVKNWGKIHDENSIWKILITPDDEY